MKSSVQLKSREELDLIYLYNDEHIEWARTHGDVWTHYGGSSRSKSWSLANDVITMANIHPLYHVLYHCQVSRKYILAQIDVYLFCSRFVGIGFMKEREAYECRKPMFVYNMFQTLFSLWVFIRFGGYWLTGKYNWTCQPVDYSMSVDGLK